MKLSAVAVAMLLTGSSSAMADAMRLEIAPGVGESTNVVEAAWIGRLEASSLEQLARQAAALSEMRKDEFEKTREFNARKANVVRQHIIGEWSIGQDLTLVVEGIGAGWLYNADEERFEARSWNRFEACSILACHTVSVSSYPAKYVSYITYSENLSKSAETGQTAMGVVFQYVKTTGLMQGISVSTFTDNLSRYDGAYHVVHSFAVPREEARTVKQNLAAAISGKLADPYLWKSMDASTPKLDAPFENAIKNEVIAFQPSELVIFDASTKKVFAKFRVNSDGQMAVVQPAAAAVAASPAPATPASGQSSPAALARMPQRHP